MKFRLVTLLCGLVWIAAAAQVQADEVDDLLAGKPLPGEEQVPEGLPSLPVLAEQFTPPLEPAPVAPGTSWEVPASHGRLSEAAERADRQPAAPAPSASVTMVPEPQAIALAVLALLYFMIFFRRRHHLT
jgi:hypothetical protein